MPQEVKRVETRTVEREDVPADSEWDSAWAVDEDEPSTNENIDDTKVDVGNKHDIEEERRVTGFGTNADDDTADAWGWGEDDDVVEEKDEKENDLPAQRSEPSQPIIPRTAPKLMEKTIFETYWMSSLPQPILKTIDAIFNDGATLLKPEYCLSIYQSRAKLTLLQERKASSSTSCRRVVCPSNSHSCNVSIRRTHLLCIPCKWKHVSLQRYVVACRTAQ